MMLSVLFHTKRLARKQVSSFFEFILSQVRVAQVVNFFQEPPESQSPAEWCKRKCEDFRFTRRNVPTSSVNPYQTLTPASRPNAHLDKSRWHSSAHIFGFRKVYSMIYDNGFLRNFEFVINSVAQIYSDCDFRRIKLVFIVI